MMFSILKLNLLRWTASMKTKRMQKDKNNNAALHCLDQLCFVLSWIPFFNFFLCPFQDLFWIRERVCIRPVWRGRDCTLVCRTTLYFSLSPLKDSNWDSPCSWPSSNQPKPDGGGVWGRWAAGASLIANQLHVLLCWRHVIYCDIATATVQYTMQYPICQ